MWQFIRSPILAVIIFIGAAHGILVVGPKFIRANQGYTVVITNFNTKLDKVDLMLRIEGHTDDGQNVLNITKSVDVRKQMNRMINFYIPKDLAIGNYKITIDGLHGFTFHKEIDLVYLSKAISGLIQIDKPVFKPGDWVQFRVIVLDTKLKPSTRIETVQVMIHDPQNNVVRKWSSAELHVGVFENELQIGSTPILGIWNISVLVHGEVLVSKTFEVKEYVLSSFDVEVVPTVIPLVEHEGLNLTIAANYHFRKPVKGLAKVELLFQDDQLNQVKEFEMSGIGQVTLRFNEKLELFNDQQDVLVKTTFIEQGTNRTVVLVSQPTVYKYPYRVELIKESPQFRPGLPFKCALQFRHHDGTPARGITGKVEVMEIEIDKTVTSDDDGLIQLELEPIDDIQEMYISFSNDDGFYFYEKVDKVDVVTKAFIKLELKSPVKINRLLQFLVTCNDRMTFFVYYIVSKGNVLESGYMAPNNQNKYPFRLNASEKMIPKVKIVVATVVNHTLVYDCLDIDFVGLHFDFSIDKQEARPGQQIELRLSGRSGAYVGLAAYEKSKLYYNQHHDLFWEDLTRLYNGFGSYNEKEFDMFHNTGLFVSTLDSIKFNEAHDMATRYESQTNNRIIEQESNRSNVPESWLWKNVTIGGSGRHTMIEAVPGTSPSWYLTGFSIDPVYGLGIIKNPIEFMTILPFYIGESLPDSIKRGEVVELQFTLFNNLEGEYIAEVTLYNVFNQMELIGRSLEDESYTKSVSVPPKVGVPISFLVKARKLGAMAIRVKASIMLGRETDALEKVIQVEPESLVQPKMVTWFFCFDTYKNQTFRIPLDIHNKADNGSLKITLRLTTNLLTTVINVLDNLLAVPSGSGEGNMIKFAPNILVLDYLHAIGSKDQILIDKARNLALQGYQHQMRYRQTDGSFGVEQNMGGSVFLTAFVAKSMQTASKYISEVDMTLVEKAYDWLASKQHRSGKFDEVGFMIFEEMQGGLRNGTRLTSFVVSAFLENDNAKVKHPEVIQKAISYLSSQVDSLDDPYDLSIVTYALMLNEHSMRDKAFSRLLTMSTFTNNATEQYWNTDHSIEATGYALMSFVIGEKYVDGIPVMRWLVKQRYVTGVFSRAQDIFVGLTALTRFTTKTSPSRNNYTVWLNYGKSPAYFHISPQASNIIIYENIPEDIKLLEVNVEGIGVGLLQVTYQYSLNLLNFENRFMLDLEKQNTTSDDDLRLAVCANFIPKGSNERSHLALIEVNFPSGYVVDQNPISEQTSFNPIQNIEFRYGGTSVVVYYNNMGIERNCFTVTAYRRLKVALKHPAYVVVYDFYDPNLNAIQSYEVDK
ncbi:CD109 antigen-like [Anopheles funestus]|uniref:CD109 antigen-like n=1 Tax=Anopheles funestus TaxID=62324 RepID=UPI0020C6CF67|nr:CD109 antigen-like [Anopheles funestus]